MAAYLTAADFNDKTLNPEILSGRAALVMFTNSSVEINYMFDSLQNITCPYVLTDKFLLAKVDTNDISNTILCDLFHIENSDPVFVRFNKDGMCINNSRFYFIKSTEDIYNRFLNCSENSEPFGYMSTNNETRDEIEPSFTYSNPRSQLRSMGDPIRGDLAILRDE